MAPKAAERKDFVRGETDVFTEHGYDITVQTAHDVIYNPTSAITETSPIEYFVQGNDLQYLDLTKTRIKLRCKVVSNTGADIAKEADLSKLNYAPANYLVGSAFQNVSVHINESEATPKTTLYFIQAYFEQLLNHGSDYKKGLGEAAGFFRVKDEAKQTDEGWVSRKDLCDESKEFEVIGRLHGCPFNLDNFFFPGFDFRISLHRNPDNLIMECHGTDAISVKFKILEAQLIMRKLTLLPSIHLAQLKIWQERPLVYQGTNILMKSYSLPVGTYHDTKETLLNGLLPERLIIGLVGTENIQGSYTTHPYNFEDHGIERMTVTCNGEVSTSRTIQMDKSTGRFLDGFTSLFETMGITHCDSGLDIRRNEYMQGKQIYGFDLRKYSSDGRPIPRHGNVTIYIKLKSALTKSVTVVVYPEYPHTMYIDHHKRITYKDFAREYQ